MDVVDDDVVDDDVVDDDTDAERGRRDITQNHNPDVWCF